MRLGSFILALLAPFVASSQGLENGLAAHNQPSVDALAHSILTLWRVIGPLAARVDAAPQNSSRVQSRNHQTQEIADAKVLPLALLSAQADAQLKLFLPTNQKLLLRC